ncbi:MAG: SDR family oxidoreductase [Gammaproteobacteria bacterium]|nr:SDR family oxidoreductase [Gammaproteobacteria bacterium]
MKQQHASNIIIMGCGYIGQLVASELADKNVNVSAMVHTDTSLKKCAAQKLSSYKIDLDDKAAELPEKFTGTAGRILYLVPPPRSGASDSRIHNFLNLLKHSAPEKMVLISTTGVYGDCEGKWINEDTPANPQVDRARRRLDAEQQAAAYCKKKHIPLVVLRVPGIYGSGKLPIKRIKSGEPIVRAEDSGFSNRIHAIDLANICAQAIVDDKISGIYNCCDGNPSTMNDYFMKVADTLGLPRPPEISMQQAGEELSPGMMSYLAESKRISNEKLLKDFNYVFQYPDLDAGLKNI